VSPAQRYKSVKAFLADLVDAIKRDREHALPPLQTAKREWAKISKVLRHSFYGTLLAMIIIRPIFAHFELVQLSDNAWVGVFHGVIGSIVWGVLIPAGFILYLVLFERRLNSRIGRYAVASICCGLGGLIGGVIVSLPSVFVTNEWTLRCLGWLRILKFTEGYMGHFSGRK